MSTEKKETANKAIQARLKLLKLDFPADEVTTEMMMKMRVVLAKAGEDIVKLIQQRSGYDEGRLIHTLDLLNQAANTACTSVVLALIEENNFKDKMKKMDSL